MAGLAVAVVAPVVRIAATFAPLAGAPAVTRVAFCRVPTLAAGAALAMEGAAAFGCAAATVPAGAHGAAAGFAAGCVVFFFPNMDLKLEIAAAALEVAFAVDCPPRELAVPRAPFA